MALKSETRTRKPARTIEERIADLQTKQEAINMKRATSLAARHLSFTEQLAKAEARVTTIKENIAVLVEEAKGLGVELGEATEAETVTAETVEVENDEA